MNFIGPVLGAGLFVAIMSMVPDPARRSFNAIVAAGAVGAYIGGGFDILELIYPLLATSVVYLGLRSYRAIGVAWLMHAAWDLPHQLTGHPIWPYMRYGLRRIYFARSRKYRNPDRRDRAFGRRG